MKKNVSPLATSTAPYMRDFFLSVDALPETDTATIQPLGVTELTIRTHVCAISITEPMPPEPKALKRFSIRVLSWPVVA